MWKKRYRHWACLYQVLAAAFLASVSLLGGIRLITDAPHMAAALVPYAYSQKIEDRYETRQFQHAGISNVKTIFQQWATKPNINENDEVLYFATYFRMSTGAIDRHLLLGVVPRAFSLISTLGGFFTVLGAVMSSISKKKNADDKIARVYDERTMSCMKYFLPGTTDISSKGKHADLKWPHSALPATQSFPPPGFPPGLNHRETE